MDFDAAWPKGNTTIALIVAYLGGTKGMAQLPLPAWQHAHKHTPHHIATRNKIRGQFVLISRSFSEAKPVINIVVALYFRSIPPTSESSALQTIQNACMHCRHATASNTHGCTDR
jgi:hypothetical protein